MFTSVAIDSKTLTLHLHKHLYSYQESILLYCYYIDIYEKPITPENMKERIIMSCVPCHVISGHAGRLHVCINVKGHRFEHLIGFK